MKTLDETGHLLRRCCWGVVTAVLLFAGAYSVTAYGAELLAGQSYRDNGAVLVPVQLLTGERGEVAGLQFDLEFDPAHYQLEALTLGLSGEAAGKEPLLSEPRPGVARVIITGFNQTALPDGEVALLHLRPMAGATGDDQIALSRVLASDPFGYPVETTVAAAPEASQNQADGLAPEKSVEPDETEMAGAIPNSATPTTGLPGSPARNGVLPAQSGDDTSNLGVGTSGSVQSGRAAIRVASNAPRVRERSATDRVLHSEARTTTRIASATAPLKRVGTAADTASATGMPVDASMHGAGEIPGPTNRKNRPTPASVLLGAPESGNSEGNAMLHVLIALAADAVLLLAILAVRRKLLEGSRARRVLGALLVLALGLSMQSLSAAELKLEQRSPTPDSTDAILLVQLIPGDAEAVAGLQFDLSYDIEAVRLIQVEAGASANAADKILHFNNKLAGRARVVLAGFNQNEIPDGVVAQCRFEQLAEGTGHAAFALESVILSDPFGEKVEVTRGGNGAASFAESVGASAPVESSSAAAFKVLAAGVFFLLIVVFGLNSKRGRLAR